MDHKTMQNLAKSFINIKITFFLILLSDLPTISESTSNTDFYTFSANDIHGNKVNLNEYRGRVTLVVNVASKCGFTESHYKGLSKLQDILNWGGKFSVLAFPCNQFGDQEPEPDEAIDLNIKEKYKIDFPMFSKINVIGSDAHLAWKNLAEQANQAPDWNFWKYLVNPEGVVVKAWGPTTSVESIFDAVREEVSKLEEKENGSQKDKKEL